MFEVPEPLFFSILSLRAPASNHILNSTLSFSFVLINNTKRLSRMFVLGRAFLYKININIPFSNKN